MSECRVCLINNVRMHSIYNTWYQDMYEKLSGLKLGQEDGKPETVCYVCTWQLQKFYNFFEMAQNAENILTKRLLFGEMVQAEELKMLHNLKMTSTQSISYVDSGEEEEPEVIVTVKEEPLDYDSDFKEDYFESPFEQVNDEEITKIESTPDIGIHISEGPIDNKEWPEIDDKEFPKIKTEHLDENPDMAETLLRNLTLALDNFQTDLKFCPKITQNYFCTKCNYKTHTSNALKRHSKVHDPDNKYSCKHCAYRFLNEKKLIAHRNHCTVCSICAKRFSNTHALKIHVRLHTGIQPYVCDSCGRGFNQKTNLQTHMRVHTREKQYPCLNCNKTFPFKSFLQRHMLIHSENVDEKSFRRIIDCHKVFVRKRKAATSTCNICGKVLCSRSLAMHMKQHTGEKIACERCNRVFIQKCNLLTHVERVHAGDVTLCCHICHKMFPFSSEMWTHLATHDYKSHKTESNEESQKMYESEKANEEVYVKTEKNEVIEDMNEREIDEPQEIYSKDNTEYEDISEKEIYVEVEAINEEPKETSNKHITKQTEVISDKEFDLEVERINDIDIVEEPTEINEFETNQEPEKISDKDIIKEIVINEEHEKMSNRDTEFSDKDINEELEKISDKDEEIEEVNEIEMNEEYEKMSYRDEEVSDHDINEEIEEIHEITNQETEIGENYIYDESDDMNEEITVTEMREEFEEMSDINYEPEEMSDEEYNEELLRINYDVHEDSDEENEGLERINYDVHEESDEEINETEDVSDNEFEEYEDKEVDGKVELEMTVKNDKVFTEAEFEIFNQKFLIPVHSSIHRGEIMPYRCDLCGRLRVLSY